MDLQAQIKNFSYQKCWNQKLRYFGIADINKCSSRCLVMVAGKTLALSKWVSPKRTRSYPYARVYDTFDVPASKVATIIPLIKDEGVDGDVDYLQWDTVALMSLLGVYVILGFYDRAQRHRLRHKITRQQFKHAHISEHLTKLTNYHQSALHWNLHQLENENLQAVLTAIEVSYRRISDLLNVKMHPFKNIQAFAKKIAQSRSSFVEFSRKKAQKAQIRESLIVQPKEHIGVGDKSRLVIENYLGGQYFFTVDDVIHREGILYLCESKHSKNALLPSKEDIKDGLLKLMLYRNLDHIQGFTCFKVVLRLTSDVLQDRFTLPNACLQDLLQTCQFSPSQAHTLQALNTEAQHNHFEVWINHGLS